MPNAQLILSHTGQASTQKTLKKPKIMLLQTHMTFYLDWNTKGNVLHEVDAALFHLIGLTFPKMHNKSNP